MSVKVPPMSVPTLKCSANRYPFLSLAHSTCRTPALGDLIRMASALSEDVSAQNLKRHLRGASKAITYTLLFFWISVGTILDVRGHHPYGMCCREAHRLRFTS